MHFNIFNFSTQQNSIKADLIKNVKRVRRLTRTNSTLNLGDQLGVRGRPRLRRNNVVSERAASRSRGRSASRNRGGNLIRSNSKQNLRGRSASRQRQAAAPVRLNRSNSRLNRSNSRLNLRAQATQQQGANARRRSRSQSRSNVRANTSVNARLGVKRQNIVGQKQGPRQRQQRQPNNQQGLRNVQRGRITKRPNPNTRRNQLANGLQQQQRGRSRSRFFFAQNSTAFYFLLIINSKQSRDHFHMLSDLSNGFSMNA